MKYNSYRFIYPPRPENIITHASIDEYDNGRYFGQPKYNGSNCVVFMDDTGFLKVMGRHNEQFHPSKLKLDLIDFASAYRGKGFMVLCGELLNKALHDEKGKLFNQKFIIWDIIVYNGEYLIDTTLEQRVKLLDELYPQKEERFSHLIYFGSDSVFRTPTYKKNFKTIYKELVETDLYEGFIMKRRDAKLEYGMWEKNNHTWQFKVRKPTKNYRH